MPMWAIKLEAEDSPEFDNFSWENTETFQELLKARLSWHAQQRGAPVSDSDVHIFSIKKWASYI